MDFQVKTYNTDVQEAVDHFHFQPVNTVVTHTAIYKGTTYKANMCVVLSEKDDGYSLGKILLILVEKTFIWS